MRLIRQYLHLKMAEKLLCKTQLAINEPGEFTAEYLLSFEEALQLASDFPWEEERKNVKIGLTTASITMKSENGCFLKLALSYNGKFVLYYFDQSGLFKKIIPTLQASFPDIRLFFDTGEKAADFKKENTIFQHPEIHFQTRSFRYYYQKKFIYYTDWYTRIILPVWVAYIIYVLVELVPAKGAVSGLFILLFMLLMFPLFGGLNLLLCIRYYRVFKDLNIVLSRGAGSFQYGTANKLETIQKSDIADITVLRNNSSRCPWNNYSLTRIGLYDNRELDIPSTLIDSYTIIEKFPLIKVEQRFDYAPFPKRKAIN